MIQYGEQREKMAGESNLYVFGVSETVDRQNDALKVDKEITRNQKKQWSKMQL